MIRKILTYFHNFSVLFSMVSNLQKPAGNIKSSVMLWVPCAVSVLQERFLPFLDMFQKDSVRVEVCRAIMEVFIK